MQQQGTGRINGYGRSSPKTFLKGKIKLSTVQRFSFRINLFLQFNTCTLIEAFILNTFISLCLHFPSFRISDHIDSSYCSTRNDYRNILFFHAVIWVLYCLLTLLHWSSYWNCGRWCVFVIGLCKMERTSGRIRLCCICDAWYCMPVISSIGCMTRILALPVGFGGPGVFYRRFASLAIAVVISAVNALTLNTPHVHCFENNHTDQIKAGFSDKFLLLLIPVSAMTDRYGKVSKYWSVSNGQGFELH